jgi:hypothetical protein
MRKQQLAGVKNQGHPLRQFKTYELYSFDSICAMWQCRGMEWDVLYDETFVAELAEIERQSGSSAVREEIAALALLLRRFGPTLRRPHCDTLKGSKHANMKELCFTLPDGEWRLAFVLCSAPGGHPAGGRQQVGHE